MVFAIHTAGCCGQWYERTATARPSLAPAWRDRLAINPWGPAFNDSKSRVDAARALDSGFDAVNQGDTVAALLNHKNTYCT